MNFTKEYIELCKNPKVQGLRKAMLKGDWYCFPNGNTLMLVIDEWDLKLYPSKTIWLPTSDQIDEIILNICKEKFNGYFQYEMCFITTEWYGSISYWKESEEYMKDCQKLRYAIQIKENPLIAKLKLLLSLLEREE